MGRERIEPSHLDMSHLSFWQACGTGFGTLRAERSRNLEERVQMTRWKSTCKGGPL